MKQNKRFLSLIFINFYPQTILQYIDSYKLLLFNIKTDYFYLVQTKDIVKCFPRFDDSNIRQVDVKHITKQN